MWNHRGQRWASLPCEKAVNQAGLSNDHFLLKLGGSSWDNSADVLDWVWDKNGPLCSPSSLEELPTGVASPFTASRILPSLLQQSVETSTYWSLLSSWPLDILAKPFMRPQSRPPCHRYLVEIPGPFQAESNKENMLSPLSQETPQEMKETRCSFSQGCLPINPTLRSQCRKFWPTPNQRFIGLLSSVRGHVYLLPHRNAVREKLTLILILPNSFNWVTLRRVSRAFNQQKKIFPKTGLPQI